MSIILYFLLLLVSLIIIPIFIVMFIKNVTFFNAVDIIFNTLDSWNKKANEAITFDVLIGFNGFGFDFYEIEQRFENFHNYWEIYSLIHVDNTSNDFIVYTFKVFNLTKKNMSKNILLYHVQNIAEAALILHFREHNILMATDKFVAVAMRGNILKIAIAKNCKGFEYIQKNRLHLN